jgi:hypothetical protein
VLDGPAKKVGVIMSPSDISTAGIRSFREAVWGLQRLYWGEGGRELATFAAPVGFDYEGWWARWRSQVDRVNQLCPPSKQFHQASVEEWCDIDQAEERIRLHLDWSEFCLRISIAYTDSDGPFDPSTEPVGGTFRPEWIKSAVARLAGLARKSPLQMARRFLSLFRRWQSACHRIERSLVRGEYGAAATAWEGRLQMMRAASTGGIESTLYRALTALASPLSKVAAAILPAVRDCPLAILAARTLPVTHAEMEEAARCAAVLVARLADGTAGTARKVEDLNLEAAALALIHQGKKGKELSRELGFTQRTRIYKISERVTRALKAVNAGRSARRPRAGFKDDCGNIEAFA